MRLLYMAAMIIFSTGWLAPFSWSIWIIYKYISGVVWPQARWGQPYNFPFHFFDIAPYVFLVSVVWLFFVMVFWIVKIETSRASEFREQNP